MRREWAWLAPLAAMIVALYLAASVAVRAAGIAPPSFLVQYFVNTLLLPVFVVSLSALVLALRMLLVLRKGGSLVNGYIRLDLPDVVSRLAPLVLMPVMLAAYATLKMLIPVLHGFTADGALHDLDRILFLGTDPWRLTHALFGNAAATMAIDRLYTMWVPLLGLAMTYFALAAGRRERARFFLTFAAVWIGLGTVGAYIGASAGPCFLAQLNHPAAPAYAELMERLAAIRNAAGAPLMAYNWQQVLWAAHRSNDIGFGMGISAMPSIHLAVATLYVLAARRHGRVATAIAALFGATMLVGSVHLGWHYAADGLFSILATSALWWIAGRYLDWAGVGDAVASGAAHGEAETLPPAGAAIA